MSVIKTDTKTISINSARFTIQIIEESNQKRVYFRINNVLGSYTPVQELDLLELKEIVEKALIELE